MVTAGGQPAQSAADWVLTTTRSVRKGLDTTREVPRELIEDCLQVAMQAPVAFEVGDAHHVDLLDDTFDLCRTERVLRYLASPETAVGEMARVARPGGSVLAFDFDSDQTIVDAPDPALARRIAEVLDAAVPHPWVGRQLFGLFKRAGLRDVRVVPVTPVLTTTLDELG